MFKKLLLLLLWATTAQAATKFNPFINNLDYTSSTGAALLASTQTFSGRNTWSSTGSSTFTYQLVVGSLSFVSSGNGGINGTLTNDDASTTTYYGAYLSTITAARVNLPTTAQFGNLLSTTVPAGDWMCYGAVNFFHNGATVPDAAMGFSTTSGNSETGMSLANTEAYLIGPVPASQVQATVLARVSLNAPTTYYLKYYADYTVATPQATGKFMCIRIR